MSALFTQEVERLVGSAVSEAAPVRVVVGGWHPALRGVDIGRAPTIWGWSETRPRPEARHVLTTPEGAPVLSVWRRGLGQVAALTTDDGARWARGWPRWSDSARFYTQLARDLARDRAGQQDVLRFVGSPAGPTIEVHHQNNLQQPILTEGRTLTMQVDGSQAAAPALTLSGVGHQTGRVEAPVGSEVVLYTQYSGAALDNFEVKTKTISATPSTLSMAAGGVQTVNISMGAAHAGELYLLLGSTSGTAPGTPAGAGYTLPLNTDSYLLWTLANANGAPLANSFGALDAAGKATSTFTLPAGFDPTLVGITIHHAAVVFDPIPTLTVTGVTDAAPVTFGA